MNEFELIDTYFKDLAWHREEIVYGIGDDAACVRVPPGQELFISTDTLVADVHFSSNWDPYDIAWKAMMVNLSDMAAMAATPCWLTLALTLPKNDEAWFARFSQGLHTALNQYKVSLIGGDTTKGPLSITITIHGLAPLGKGCRRSGANVSDEIWVSGPLGAAALALRAESAWDGDDRAVLQDALRHPKPRVDLQAVLQQYATSAIDISDGLGADLKHLCDASGVGACLSLQQIPVHPLLFKYLGAEAIEFSMQGGDDYELCFTSAASLREPLQRTLSALDVICYPIGIVEAAAGIRAIDHKRDLHTFAAQGYRHF